MPTKTFFLTSSTNYYWIEIKNYNIIKINRKIIKKNSRGSFQSSTPRWKPPPPTNKPTTDYHQIEKPPHPKPEHPIRPPNVTDHPRIYDTWICVRVAVCVCGRGARACTRRYFSFFLLFFFLTKSRTLRRPYWSASILHRRRRPTSLYVLNSDVRTRTVRILFAAEAWGRGVETTPEESISGGWPRAMTQFLGLSKSPTAVHLLPARWRWRFKGS